MARNLALEAHRLFRPLTHARAPTHTFFVMHTHTRFVLIVPRTHTFTHTLRNHLYSHSSGFESFFLLNSPEHRDKYSEHRSKFHRLQNKYTLNSYRMTPSSAPKNLSKGHIIYRFRLTLSSSCYVLIRQNVQLLCWRNKLGTSCGISGLSAAPSAIKVFAQVIIQTLLFKF